MQSLDGSPQLFQVSPQISRGNVQDSQANNSSPQFVETSPQFSHGNIANANIDSAAEQFIASDGKSFLTFLILDECWVLGLWSRHLLFTLLSV